jgi:Sec-independent protein secretion pathway component TatC
MGFWTGVVFETPIVMAVLSKICLLKRFLMLVAFVPDASASLARN